MAGGIFVSYRRNDSRHAAGRLLDRLRQTYPRHQLFMDVDDIAPGQDFVKVLLEQVAACDVMLVIIGPSWLDARDEAGARRLDNPTDFVRIEVEAALKRDVRVIPVYVDGAPILHEDALPAPIRALTRRQSVRLTHEQFGSETDNLVRSLLDAVPPLAKEGQWLGLSPITWGRPESLVLALALTVIGVVLPYAVLEWDDLARRYYRLGTIPIVITSEVPNSKYPEDASETRRIGIYTHQGIPGVLVGVVLPLCFLAAAAVIGFGRWKSVRPDVAPPSQKGPPPPSSALRGPPPPPPPAPAGGPPPPPPAARGPPPLRK